MRPATIVSDLAPTGVLRASINLGNPVLAQGTPAAPSGVTVDIARELGARLGVRSSSSASTRPGSRSRRWHRAGPTSASWPSTRPRGEVAFTAPYVIIEGVFAVPEDSTLTTAGDVDRPGVRVGVKRGSAYDLFLSRTLGTRASCAGDEGVDGFTRRSGWRSRPASGSRWPTSWPPIPMSG